MKQLLALTIAALVIVSLVIFGFTLWQVGEQRDALMEDLQYRTSLLADSLKESIRPTYLNRSAAAMQGMLDKFAGREKLLGLAVYDEQGNLFAKSASLSLSFTADTAISNKAIDIDSAEGDIIVFSDAKIYVFATPLHKDEKVIGALVVYQKADHIDAAIRDIWKTNLVRLLIQALLFLVAIFVFLRWIVYQPILRTVEAIRKTRSGKMNGNSNLRHGNSFFDPIATEVLKMSQSLMSARMAASEEARMRLEKLDSPWTADRLKEFFKAYLKDRQIFVVSNREPYVHKRVKQEIVWDVPASGMVTALEPIMEACGGLWLAHGSGDADRETVDEQDKIGVPPDEPKYTLKRVWLTEEEISGYYVGFSNEALWPLCHLAHTRPIFRKEDWDQYRKVNEKFARSLLEEIKHIQRPIVLVQDYHFALLPQLIKQQRPDVQIGIFWHIPWPNEESFSICPWRKEILEGMLGADIVGFHTQQYCNNFMNTVGREIEAMADLEKFSITRAGHTTYIKPFPISVAFKSGVEVGQASAKDFLDRHGIKTPYIGIGVDRMDYTKGILERFKAIEFFFDIYPDFKEQFTFLQIAPPSREGVEKYRQFNEQVMEEAARINAKLMHDRWKPIVLINEHHTHGEIYPLYRAANMCLVTSLSDGMNLVAKEFVVAREDNRGVLILSQFTGASRDLRGAITVNPYSAEETAVAIHQAITMPEAEQTVRMKKMRESVRNYSVYRWAAEFIKIVADL